MKNYFGENEIILAHGTNCDPNTILHGGFKNVIGVWNCSEFDLVYFYEFSRWIESEGYEDEDKEGLIDAFVRRANEQGQVARAFEKTPINETYVLEFHFPEEFEKYILKDVSCPNMDAFGCVQVDMQVINKWMKEGKCKVIVRTFSFASKCALLYLTGLVDNEFAEDSIDKLPLVEKEALKVLATGGFNESFYEDYISWPDEIETYEVMFPICDQMN